MKIGILTYHRAVNYGAFLQAYALCNRLNQEKDIIAEIIDFRMLKEKKHYNQDLKLQKFLLKPKNYFFKKKLNKVFYQSLNKLKKSNNYVCADELNQNILDGFNHYDIIIVGSDEIWKIDGFRGFPTPYWLPFKTKSLKFSYAASSRTILDNYNQDIKEEASKLLNDFECISVRDKITFEQFKKNLDIKKNIFISRDPTLIFEYSYNLEKGKMILNKLKLNKLKKNMLIMIDDKKIVKKIIESCKEQYNFISVFTYHMGCKNISNLNPFEWLDLIGAVDFICTSYFHATCFAIKFNKMFLTFGVQHKSDKTKELLIDSKNEYRFLEYTENVTCKDIYKKIISCIKRTDNNEFISTCRDEFAKYLILLRKKGGDYENKNK